MKTLKNHYNNTIKHHKYTRISKKASHDDEILENTNDTLISNNNPVTTNETLHTNENTSLIVSNTSITSDETFDPKVDIEPETVNCLALTIQNDHKLIKVKNTIGRMSWKVILSSIGLAILKLFYSF